MLCSSALLPFHSFLSQGINITIELIIICTCDLLGNSTPKWTKKKWSGTISCIELFDWLILFWISTSWKGLWISLYIYDACRPTSEITQLPVNNTCGTSWSNFGQKHQFLVMCVHSEQENYSTKWYSFLLMVMHAWLVWYLLRKSEI